MRSEGHSRNLAGGSATHATLAFHWARMIEMLHSAEAIQELLQDDDLLSDDLSRSGERQLQGVGRDRSAARHADPPLSNQ